MERNWDSGPGPAAGECFLAMVLVSSSRSPALSGALGKLLLYGENLIYT